MQNDCKCLCNLDPHLSFNRAQCVHQFVKRKISSAVWEKKSFVPAFVAVEV